MQQVFVFGTLKQGFPNHNCNSGMRLSGNYHTLQKYPLYIVGERFSPWLILDPGKGHQVKGQVFTVDSAGLAKMDKLERTDQADGYRRIELAVVSDQLTAPIKVFAYVKSVNQLQVAKQTVELRGEYLLEHALLYSSRSR
ncbi:gamma-glutamylcyclotransferase ['Osedax' symbiont bacterium Rs2_46_30_T18]|nr:gamma-glutamylcyclotransferase ['Osedax' symbiont bacterium Rs2_46_30_T18]